MGALGNTIGAILKRPFIIIFFAIFSLGYSIVDYNVPVLNLIVLLNTFMDGDLYQSLFTIIQWILKIIVTFKGILVITVAVIIISLLIAIVLSGYFSIINNTLDRKTKFKGEFGEGLRKYFIKIWIMSMIGMIITILFILVLMVAGVPALIVTKAAAVGKSGYFLTAVLVDFITVGVAFFGFMFLRIYLIFWFPSVFENDKKAFSKGKRLVDTYFWSIVVKFLLLDILFIIFQILAVNAGNSLAFLPAKWIFNTLFFGFYITYVFSLFKYYKIKNERRLQRQNEQKV